MKAFESYFSNDAIIAYLCKLRVKVAKRRNKKHLIHLLTDSDKYNYHINDKKKLSNANEQFPNELIKYENQFLSELDKLFPSRKKWVNLGSKQRTNQKTSQLLSSSDKNYYSLIKTIKSCRKKNPNESWLIELDKFIGEIQYSISNCSFNITSPVIYPKLKDEIKRTGTNKCRPISLFTLKDRVILSITNKFLTSLFDRYFEDCSYAFRSKKNKENKLTLTHHDCIVDVFEYKKRYSNQPLWVVECDMEKFYDSVNHKIIIDLFNKLIDKSKSDYPRLDFTNPSYIFHEFLNCYAFNKNIPSKSNIEYWKSYKIINGEFEWVEKRFSELGYYNNLESERIGIPQGGALSGLIANIVLNESDKEVLKTNAFYVRFCDDMLIISPNLDVCNNAKEIYINSLKNLKLVPHDFNQTLYVEKRNLNINSNITLKPFWNCKSKGPYKWDSVNNNGFPWIGFVGYEMHYEGHIRVRKKSLLKELKKQKEVIDEIKKAVSSKMRKSKGSVSESAIHRLVGMSVGRITLHNFKTVSNDLCWKNGFKKLTKNKYSVQQIKQLDRNRSRLYYKLIKDLEKSDIEIDKNIPNTTRQVIHFNKPFSYFYQILERET